MRNLRGTYFKFCLHAGTFLTFLPKCWTRLLTGLSSLCPRCSGDKVAPGCVAAQEPLALLSSLKQTLRLFKTWAGRGWVGGADGSGVGGSCFGIAGALLVLITFSFQSFHHCIRFRTSRNCKHLRHILGCLMMEGIVDRGKQDAGNTRVVKLFKDGCMIYLFFRLR